MPKSGTSSIQKTLLRNKNAILRSGVFFDYSDQLYDIGNGTVNVPLKIPDVYHTAILSDEKLFKGIRGVDGARRVLDELKRQSDQIVLVCYVRRQDEVFVSSYFTSLLGGSIERFEDRPLEPFKIYERLRVWDLAFGQERMLVRRYGPDYLPAGVVADFLKHVGLGGQEIREIPRVNASPRADTLEAIRSINETVPRADRAALKLIASHPGAGKRLGLSAESRRQLVDMAAVANTKLSHRYFDGEPVFTHAFPDDGIEPVTLDAAQVVSIGNMIAKKFEIDPGAPSSDITSALNWLHHLAQRCVDRRRATELTPQAGEVAG